MTSQEILQAFQAGKISLEEAKKALTSIETSHELPRILRTEVQVRKRSEEGKKQDLLKYTCSTKNKASRRSLNIDVTQVCHTTNEATRDPGEINGGEPSSGRLSRSACGAAGCLSG